MSTPLQKSQRWTAPVLPLAVLLMALAQPQVGAAELTVQVRNLKSDQGQIRIAVFNRAESFPKDMFQGQIFPAQSGSVAVVFRDLPPGTYAVSAYHDVNGNEKLDSNMLGIPSEPYGFSRNARGTIGPPKFAEARIEVGSAPVSIEMDLK